MYQDSDSDVPDEFKYRSLNSNSSGPGALLYKGATDKLLNSKDVWNGKMEPGGILRLDGHSVIFLGYSYDDKNQIMGINYWDQWSSKAGDDYLYSTLDKQYPDHKVVSGANPNP